MRKTTKNGGLKHQDDNGANHAQSNAAVEREDWTNLRTEDWDFPGISIPGKCADLEGEEGKQQFESQKCR